ncbi:hypothetical protein [Paraeggerthella hongkongensis]|uniref:Uncharacterized protein n=1 Tax=Paraeggerthella hongkongensis TaxID=230658 RepID=A0A3N0BJW4_9ACTN|nr:hypothetical protein [Paraeggerthella hongkongensis]RNL48085.1 hypothetical protein DMP08_02710 [Paraeggerthella hongkongensis]
MSKDKRVKGCSNPECPKAESKVQYKSDECFCVTCGSELVFVCAKCHGPLDDEGAKHRVCAACEAAAEDKKAKIVDGAKKAGGVVVGVAGTAIAVLLKKR